MIRIITIAVFCSIFFSGCAVYSPTPYGYGGYGGAAYGGSYGYGYGGGYGVGITPVVPAFGFRPWGWGGIGWGGGGRGWGGGGRGWGGGGEHGHGGFRR
jgi:hypothetical protein